MRNQSVGRPLDLGVRRVGHRSLIAFFETTALVPIPCSSWPPWPSTTPDADNSPGRAGVLFDGDGEKLPGRALAQMKVRREGPQNKRSSTLH